MDPRDPRLAQQPVPDDEPSQWQRDQREQEQHGAHRPLVQIGPDPTADARWGPPAPIPQWEGKPEKPFNREKFLLYLVGWIIGVHFSLFVVVGLVCSYGFAVKINKVTSTSDQISICPNIKAQIKEAAAESLAVLLALLGGGAVAVGEYQRRNPMDDPRNRW